VQVPERVSPRYRNRVLRLSCSYRNPSVEYEPETDTTGCWLSVGLRRGDSSSGMRQQPEHGTLDGLIQAGGGGLEPPTS
jgi:hypothetical protein